MDKYILGSDKKLEIEVTVLNAAEDAFEASVYLTLPEEVRFVRIDHDDKDSSPGVLCLSPSEESGQPTLGSEIGNPLAAFCTRPSSPSCSSRPPVLPVRTRPSPSLPSSKPNPLWIFCWKSKHSSGREQSTSLPIRVETDLSIRG